ncbi:hypothetical protein CI610_02021 [invertebrate metagenome]|uniref:Uncharacterized protein n=1 Tax=invertebrate metagenome TaxID=1711999 RepID=A0A2H9T730_9ZZZZ
MFAFLKQGDDAAYHAFVLSQKDLGSAVTNDVDGKKPMLSKSAFMQLAALIGAQNEVAYKVLEDTAIISTVSLSPQTKQRAAGVLKSKLPEDSVQFLSATAHYAEDIYPLAKEIINKYPSAKEKIEVVFLKNSYLRHMMYDEGAAFMYQELEGKITNDSLSLSSLDLWYAYWVINTVGFRGTLTPEDCCIWISIPF